MCVSRLAKLTGKGNTQNMSTKQAIKTALVTFNKHTLVCYGEWERWGEREIHSIELDLKATIM